MINISDGARIRRRIGNDISFSIFVKNLNGDGENFAGKNPLFNLISPRKGIIPLEATFEKVEGAYTGKVFFTWKASQQKIIGEYQFVFTETYLADSGFAFDKKAFIILYASNDDFDRQDDDESLTILVDNETSASIDAREAANEAREAAEAVANLEFQLDMETGILSYLIGQEVIVTSLSPSTIRVECGESGKVYLASPSTWTAKIQ